MQETILKIRYLETGLSKNLYQVNIFSFAPSPFYGQDYEERGLERVTSFSLGCKILFFSDLSPRQF